MKKAVLRLIGVLLVLTSIGIAAYPFISNYLSELNTESLVYKYLDSVSGNNENNEKLLEQAREYNKSLTGSLVSGDPFLQDEAENSEYQKQMSVDGSSVMGTIDIPKINVNLPIFHGTGNDALENGVGHISQTSLPVGGKGTHCVLTGHTGYSSKKLFSDVNQLEEGDVFFIHSLEETLAYQVDNIAVVLPDDTRLLQIDSEQDYVTLVTCTPFGINSHRLLVRGTRIAYDEARRLTDEYDSSDSTWNYEYKIALLWGVLVMLAILAIFAIIRLIMFIVRKRKKNENTQ